MKLEATELDMNCKQISNHYMVDSIEMSIGLGQGVADGLCAVTSDAIQPILCTHHVIDYPQSPVHITTLT